MSVRRFSNPDQFTLTSKNLETVPNGVGNPLNFLGIKVHDGHGLCCDDLEVPCAYDATMSVLNVSSITFKGKTGSNVTVAFTAQTTEKGIRTEIAKALMANGIDPYYKGDDYHGITIVGTRLRLVSTVEIVSAIVNSSSVNFTKKCTGATEKVYTIVFDVDTDPKKVSEDATAGTQIGTTGGFATGEAADAKTAIETALGTENFTLTRPVVVTEADGEFTAKIYVANKSLWYNGVELTVGVMNPTWVA